MRPLKTPPQAFDPASIAKVMGIFGRPETVEYLAKANKEYYHWEELRRQPPPAGLTAEEGWTAVKLSRSARRLIPLLDVQGRPFSFWLPPAAYHIMHRADRQGGGVLAAKEGQQELFTEMRDRVLRDSLMEEAIATSQIEGAVTTRRVAKEMLRSGRKPKNKSEQMIVNGYSTITLIRDRARQPLSMDLLHEIQASMTHDTLDDPRDAGRLRTSADDIHVVDVRDGQIVFTPPPASQLQARLQRLIDFANSPCDESDFIHPLIRAAILHFWLAYEHPYVDGNGRTARALFYWSMLKAGYWLFEFLTISRVILSAPMKYYRAFLHAESDENDLTYFLMFQFEVTGRALNELHDRLDEMQKQQSRIRSLRLTKELNSRQIALVDHALRHPAQIYTVESHQRSHNVSNETARHDLLKLTAQGLLAETGTGRPRRFMAATDLRKMLKQP